MDALGFESIGINQSISCRLWLNDSFGGVIEQLEAGSDLFELRPNLGIEILDTDF